MLQSDYPAQLMPVRSSRQRRVQQLSQAQRNSPPAFGREKWGISCIEPAQTLGSYHDLSWFIQKFLICWILNRPKWDLKQYQVTKLGVFLRNKPGDIWSGLGQSFPSFTMIPVVPVPWTTQNSHSQLVFNNRTMV